MEKLWKIVVIIIVALVISGGGTYYFMNEKLEKKESDCQSEIESLQLQFEDLGLGSEGELGQNISGKFIHKNLGFSFEIPPGYVISDNYNCAGGCNSYITILKKLSAISFEEVGINIKYNKFGGTVEEMIKREQETDDNLGEEQILIDGSEGIKVSVGGLASGFDYFGVKNDYNLKIVQYPSNEENQKVVEKIISTFEFTK